MNKTLVTLVLTLLCLSVLNAEEEKFTKIDISIYTFDYAEKHKTIHFQKPQGEKLEAVRLSTANILGPFSTIMNESRAVSLHTEVINQEGITVYPVIAIAKVPSQIKEPLFILSPSDGKYAYQIFVIDSNVDDFPYGSFKMVNFSQHPVRGLVGKTQVYSKPKSITFFNPSDNVTDLLDVHFQYKLTEVWKTFGRTRWVNEKTKRKLLCAYIDQKTERMRIRSLPLKRSTSSSSE